MTCASLESSSTFAVSLPSVSHWSHPTVSADRSTTHLPKVGHLRPHIRRVGVGGHGMNKWTRTVKESCCPETTRKDFWLGQEIWSWKLKLGYQCEDSLTWAHKSLIGPHRLHFGFCKNSLGFIGSSAGFTTHFIIIHTSTALPKAQACGWTWSSLSSESTQQFPMAQNNHDPTAIDSRQDQERRLSHYLDCEIARDQKAIRTEL